MKAKLLKELLNNTGYIVHERSGKICVGSPMCPELINVDKKTLELKYSLDTFHNGRKSIDHPKLAFIWDKLSELIESGQIQEIIDGNDEIDETYLPIYVAENGSYEKKYTKAFGYPNVTADGELLYDNTSFKTEIEAIEYAISICGYALESYLERYNEAKEKMEMLQGKMKEYVAKKETHEERLKWIKTEKEQNNGTE